MFIIDPQNFSTTVGYVDETQPTRGRWDVLLQTFIAVPTETRTLDETQARALFEQTLQDRLRRLNGRPSVKSVAQNGTQMEQPARRIFCPKCGSNDLHVPVTFTSHSDGLQKTAAPGKGDVACPECSYTGTKARVKSFDMYAFVDLIRERKELWQTLKEVEKNVARPNEDVV